MNALKVLPELQGTERQVEWAGDIRLNMIETLEKLISKAEKTIEKFSSLEDLSERKQARLEKATTRLPILNEVLDLVKGATSAKGFIEARSVSQEDFVEQFLRFTEFNSPEAIECNEDREKQWQRIQLNIYLWGVIGYAFKNKSEDIAD